jgi:hypothetical protein
MNDTYILIFALGMLVGSVLTTVVNAIRYAQLCNDWHPHQWGGWEKYGSSSQRRICQKCGWQQIHLG